MRRQDIKNLIKNAVHEVEPEAEVILYGSQARSDSVSESDWDILVLLDGMVSEDRTDEIRHRLYEVEWDTGQVISSIMRNRNQWHSHPYTATPYYQNVVREGVIL